MTQVIVTKYFGPSNVKGSRIKASCHGGTLFMSYDHAHNLAWNHSMAAEKLARKFKWKGAWNAGVIEDGRYAFVCVTDALDGGFEIT